MAILGTNIDIQTVVRTGDVSVGSFYATLAHSLPGTSPDFVALSLRSSQALASQAVPALMQLGGNASILTIGYAIPSGVSVPTIQFDVAAFKFHSAIR